MNKGGVCKKKKIFYFFLFKTLHLFIKMAAYKIDWKLSKVSESERERESVK